MSKPTVTMEILTVSVAGYSYQMPTGSSFVIETANLDHAMRIWNQDYGRPVSEADAAVIREFERRWISGTASFSRPRTGR